MLPYRLLQTGGHRLEQTPAQELAAQAREAERRMRRRRRILEQRGLDPRLGYPPDNLRPKSGQRLGWRPGALVYALMRGAQYDI